MDTSLAAVHPDAPTALAFVFLDDKGERSFSFRRDQTADITITREQVGQDWFQDEPIIHFCSNTLTDEHIADVTSFIVQQARERSAIVSFDVNLRHNLWPAGKVGREIVNDLVRKSDIIKFSREELDYLAAGDEDAYLASCFAGGSTAVLVTDGPRDLEVRTAKARASVTPPNVVAVDTTGGGDAFICAVLYGLSLRDDVEDYLADIHGLERLVSSAAHCGAVAVTRQGAFPSFPTFAEVADSWSL